MPLVSDLAVVLFDFDGVILNSEPLHEKALLKLYNAHGWTVDDPRFYRFKGRTEAVNFAEITERFGGDQEAHRAEYRANYDALIADPPLVPGVVAFLDRCRTAGLKLAIVTSARRSTVAHVLEAHGLGGRFATVVADDDVTEAKPHPEPYLTAAARLGIDPARCLVVEDSLHGVASGRAAGATVAGRVESFSAEALRQAGAAIAFDDYADLAAAVWPG